MKVQKRNIILLLGLVILMERSLDSKNIASNKKIDEIKKSTRIEKKYFRENPVINEKRKLIYTRVFKCAGKIYELDYLTPRVARITNVLKNQSHQLDKSDDMAGEYFSNGIISIQILKRKIVLTQNENRVTCHEIFNKK